MNDDKVRKLLDEHSRSIGYADRRVCDLAREVLRRGEVIATHEALLSKLRSRNGGPIAGRWFDQPDFLTDAGRVLLEGEAP